MEQMKYIRLFERTDVIELTSGSIQRFYKRTEVWVIFFYKSHIEKCRNMTNMIKDVATKYFSIFKVGAINCDMETELCEDEFKVFDFPCVFVFPSDLSISQSMYVEDYFTINGLAKFAVDHMVNNVIILDDDNFKDFLY
jgi:thiol-disulfide isomerase/thioredoxin